MVLPDAHKTIRLLMMLATGVGVYWISVHALADYQARADVAVCPAQLRQCLADTSTATREAVGACQSRLAALEVEHRLATAGEVRARRTACRALDCCRADSFYTY